MINAGLDVRYMTLASRNTVVLYSAGKSYQFYLKRLNLEFGGELDSAELGFYLDGLAVVKLGSKSTVAVSNL